MVFKNKISQNFQQPPWILPRVSLPTCLELEPIHSSKRLVSLETELRSRSTRTETKNERLLSYLTVHLSMLHTQQSRSRTTPFNGINIITKHDHQRVEKACSSFKASLPTRK